MGSRIKRFGIVGLVFCLIISIGGCTAEQRKTYDSYMSTIKTYLADGKEKTDEAIKAVDGAIEKLGELITEAEKDTPPPIPGKDPIAGAIQTGTDVVTPFLPFPFNLIAGLIPFGVAWFRAKTRADKRTAEEALLIAGLQKLKKEDRPAFDRFIELRNDAAAGLLSAKQIAELLEGINEIRATYS